jgi:hypothetical protein
VDALCEQYSQIGKAQKKAKYGSFSSYGLFVADKSSPTGTRFLSCAPPEPELITTAESAVLKKLLRSEDKQLQKYAMQIIERVHARSTLPELHQLGLEKNRLQIVCCGTAIMLSVIISQFIVCLLLSAMRKRLRLLKKCRRTKN